MSGGGGGGGAPVTSTQDQLGLRLLLAVRRADATAVELLLSSSADCNFTRTSDVVGLDPELCLGRTPLHWAVVLGLDGITQQLMEHGADAKLADNMGHTAFDYAQTDATKLILKNKKRKSRRLRLRAPRRRTLARDRAGLSGSVTARHTRSHSSLPMRSAANRLSAGNAEIDSIALFRATLDLDERLPFGAQSPDGHLSPTNSEDSFGMIASGATTPTPMPDPEPEPRFEAPPSTFCSDVASLRATAKLAGLAVAPDMQFETSDGRTTIMAHRGVVGARCETLCARLAVSARDGDALVRIVAPAGVSSAALMLMFKYFYSETVEIDPKHVDDVAQLAQDFGVEELVDLCDVVRFSDMLITLPANRASFVASPSLCDVTFSVSGAKIPAVGVLFWARSRHFRAVLGAQRANGDSVIVVKRVTGAVFMLYAQYVYGDEVCTNDVEHAFGLAKFARTIDDAYLCALVERHLMTLVDGDTATLVAKGAHKLDLADLLTYCVWYMATNYGVVWKRKRYRQLPSEVRARIEQEPVPVYFREHVRTKQRRRMMRTSSMGSLTSRFRSDA